MADQRAITLGKVIEAATTTSPAYPAPTVTALDPVSGAAAGGTAIVLTGTGLSGARAVLFDGVPGTALSVVSDAELAVTSPAHGAGAVDVVVVTPGGVVTEASGYTFT
jgi:hypothetical protein